MYKVIVCCLMIAFISINCRTQIDDKNKVISIGKISTESTFMKNGAKKIVYHFEGKKYKDVASFNAQIFGFGDMFLIYLDKSNPFKYIIPEPKIKIYNLEDFLKKCNNCRTDTNDFRLTKEVE